jgi:mlo protein
MAKPLPLVQNLLIFFFLSMVPDEIIFYRTNFSSLSLCDAELMLLGFISLLLTVFQGMIRRTCIPERWTFHMLPCEKPDEKAGEAATMEHFVGTLGRIGRRLLQEGTAGAEQCQKKVIRLLELEF